MTAQIGQSAPDFDLPAIGKAVSVFNDAEVDLVLHAGDLVAPFVAKPLQFLKMDLIAVFGNNDGERLGLSKVFEGRIFRAPHEIRFAERRILLYFHQPATWLVRSVVRNLDKS